MDAFIANNLMGIIQTAAIICGILLFLKRIPSKQEVDRGDDILRADIRELRKQYNELVAKLDKSIQGLTDKIDLNNKELTEKIDANNKELNEKIDATREALTDKIDASNDKVDLHARELRSEIRELNRDYKDHIAYHTLHERSDEERGDKQ